MTLNEFLEELKEIAPLYTWHFTSGGRIQSNCGCPIETLAQFRNGKSYQYRLTEAINFLSLFDATSIICAADYPNCPTGSVVLRCEDIELRKKLLEITGLSEI